MMGLTNTTTSGSIAARHTCINTSQYGDTDVIQRLSILRGFMHSRQSQHTEVLVACMKTNNTPQKHTEVEAERNLTVNTSPAVTGCTGGNATGSNDSYTSNNSKDEHLTHSKPITTENSSLS